MSPDARVLDFLAAVIETRHGANPETSYTARLFSEGRAAIAAKVREEAEETVDAALTETRERLAAESADLLYHLCVLWADAGLDVADVWAELVRRAGTSGLAEKAARNTRKQSDEEGKPMAYDPNNIFAKIIRGEIPCDKVYEDDYALAFPDISPQAPTHVLIIPKGPYISQDDFSKNGTDAEIAAFWRAVGEVARKLGVAEAGYRFLANTGPDAHQEVMHFHVHLFAGRKLGPMLAR